MPLAPRAALLLLPLALLLGACRHTPSEKERQASDSRYELALQALGGGNPQAAYKELQEALKLDDRNARAHELMGILLHTAFARHKEAVKHYERALALRPELASAHTNLGNVYLDQGQYDAAIKEYEAALNDMLYTEPFFAHLNMGWAFHKKGDQRRAVESTKAAVALHPGLCGGYRNLGLIYEAGGDAAASCREFSRFRETCPDVAEAHYREGACLAKAGRTEEARTRFATCFEKAGSNRDLQDECRKLAGVN